VRFLADMGVARSVVRWLGDGGHDAVHLLDEGLERLSDPEILIKAAAESRILLTFDLDFAEILALSQTRPVTVILFRLRNARTTHVIERLRRALHDAGPALTDGAVVVVEDTRLRIRRLPPGA